MMRFLFQLFVLLNIIQLVIALVAWGMWLKSLHRRATPEDPVTSAHRSVTWLLAGYSAIPFALLLIVFVLVPATIRNSTGALVLLNIGQAVELMAVGIWMLRSVNVMK